MCFGYSKYFFQIKLQNFNVVCHILLLKIVTPGFKGDLTLTDTDFIILICEFSGFKQYKWFQLTISAFLIQAPFFYRYFSYGINKFSPSLMYNHYFHNEINRQQYKHIIEKKGFGLEY